MADLGKWEISIQSPMGERKSILTLNEDDGVLTGTMSSDGDEGPIENGKMEGQTVSWSMNVDKPMPITLGFSGELDGDKIEGECKFGMFGQGPFSAVKV